MRTAPTELDRLDHLEQRSVFVLREAQRTQTQLGMLWTCDADSTVVLWLARKAFFGHVPFPVLHVDTGYQPPELTSYRDRLARAYGVTLLIGHDAESRRRGDTFPATAELPAGAPGKVDRTTCCSRLKAGALRAAMEGAAYGRLDPASGGIVRDPGARPISEMIVAARDDDRGWRLADGFFVWRDQEPWRSDPRELAPPVFWDLFATDHPPGVRCRIRPLREWSELDVWEYIKREGIPVQPGYFDQGDGRRHLHIRCTPCMRTVSSRARNVDEVIAELRAGRQKDGLPP